MTCSKCGYDYPAKELKCPYCGEENKLGIAWQKEEESTRQEILKTKARVLHSMPLYVADKVVNIILFMIVMLVVMMIVITFVLSNIENRHIEKQRKLASVETAENLFLEKDDAALERYLDEYEVYGQEGYEKYTERVRIGKIYENFLKWNMRLHQNQDWEKDETPYAYEVKALLEEANHLLTQSDYRLNSIQFEENQQYMEEIQENVTASLMDNFELSEQEIEDFTQMDNYSEEFETFVKSIFDREGWKYEED